MQSFHLSMSSCCKSIHCKRLFFLKGVKVKKHKLHKKPPTLSQLHRNRKKINLLLFPSHSNFYLLNPSVCVCSVVHWLIYFWTIMDASCLLCLCISLVFFFFSCLAVSSFSSCFFFFSPTVYYARSCNLFVEIAE